MRTLFSHTHARTHTHLLYTEHGGREGEGRVQSSRAVSECWQEAQVADRERGGGGERRGVGWAEEINPRDTNMRMNSARVKGQKPPHSRGGGGQVKVGPLTPTTEIPVAYIEDNRKIARKPGRERERERLTRARTFHVGMYPQPPSTVTTTTTMVTRFLFFSFYSLFSLRSLPGLGKEQK